MAASFDEVSQSCLERFLRYRIGDVRISRLIQKWLKAGVLEDGVVAVSDKGTGQGSVASPLLANVYLHYTFDLWAARWRRREATGDMIIVRFADDIVVGFEHEADARRFRDAMRERLREFALTLHPEKTRLIEFGRHAAVERARRDWNAAGRRGGRASSAARACSRAAGRAADRARRSLCAGGRCGRSARAVRSAAAMSGRTGRP